MERENRRWMDQIGFSILTGENKSCIWRNLPICDGDDVDDWGTEAGWYAYRSATGYRNDTVRVAGDWDAQMNEAYVMLWSGSQSMEGQLK